MYKKIKTPFLLVAIAIILTPYFVAKAIKSVKAKRIKQMQSFGTGERKYQPVKIENTER